MTGPAVNILLAGDHPMAVAAVQALLHDTGYWIVAAVGRGSDVLSHPWLSGAGIVMLDLQSRGGAGMDALRQLRRRAGDRRVVLLTAALDQEALAEAKALKVDGIVLRNSDPAAMLECVQCVRSGGRWIDPALEKRASRPGCAPIASVGQPSLTRREQELVGLVRKGLRNREIAERIGVTEGTVKVYLHALFDKLGVGNRTELAMHADAGK